MKAERKMFQATLRRVAECFDQEHSIDGKKLLQDLYSQFQKAHPTIIQVDPAEVEKSQIESAKRQFDELATLLERRIKELEHQLAAEKSGRTLDRKKERTAFELECVLGFAVQALADVVTHGFGGTKCEFGHDSKADVLGIILDENFSIEFDVRTNHVRTVGRQLEVSGVNAMKMLEALCLSMTAYLIVANDFDDPVGTSERVTKEFEKALKLKRSATHR